MAKSDVVRMDLYSDEDEVRRMFQVLAEHDLDYKSASDALSHQGVWVTRHDLKKLQTGRYQGLWAQVLADYRHQLEQVIEDEQRATAVRAARALGRAVDRIDEQIDDADIVDAAKATQALAKAATAATDATLKLQGRPVDGKQQPDLAEIMAALRDTRGVEVIGEVVTEAEIVD